MTTQSSHAHMIFATWSHAFPHTSLLTWLSSYAHMSLLICSHDSPHMLTWVSTYAGMTLLTCLQCASLHDRTTFATCSHGSCQMNAGCCNVASSHIILLSGVRPVLRPRCLDLVCLYDVSYVTWPRRLCFTNGSMLFKADVYMMMILNNHKAFLFISLWYD